MNNSKAVTPLVEKMKNTKLQLDGVVKRQVKIYQGDPFRQTPDHIRTEIKKSIGSKFDKETGNTLMGLSVEERELLLPSIIGVEPNSTHWEEAVLKYYCDLTIPVPYDDPIILDASTTQKDNGLVYPVNVRDYIKYRQCVVDFSVASNKGQMGDPSFSFYMVDQGKEHEERKTLNVKLRNLDKMYVKFIEQDSDGKLKHVDKIDAMLSILQDNVPMLDVDDKLHRIQEERDKAAEELKNGFEFDDLNFVKMFRDKTLSQKGFLIKCLNADLIAKTGDTYYDANEPEFAWGRSMDEASKNLFAAANSAKLVTYKHALNEG